MLKWMRQRRASGSPLTVSPGIWIELIAHVETNRSDRRLIAEARTDGVVQIAEADAPGVRPDVAAVEEQDAAEIAEERRAKLGR